MKSKNIIPILLIFCIFTACGKDDFIPIENSMHETKSSSYVPIYTDELVPADYDSVTDSIYLPYDDELYSVNPYSNRVSPVCIDPLCNHNENEDCPLYFSRWMTLCADTGKLYYSSGQNDIIEGYSSEGKIEMRGFYGYGLTCYDINSGKKEFLLSAKDRYDHKMYIEDLTIYDGKLYFYDKVKLENDEVRQKLYRIDLENGAINDLGDYLGYTKIILKDDKIWNYYGFLGINSDPIWEVNADYFVVTDVNNKNPEKVPIYHEPVDDTNGYALARECTDGAWSGLRYLLYIGNKYPAHVYEASLPVIAFIGNEILHYDEVNQRIYAVSLTDGSERDIITVEIPQDAADISFTRIYNNEYAIFAVHDVPNKYNAVGDILYYMKIRIDNSDIGFIYLNDR